jgi:hypothetical protein
MTRVRLLGCSYERYQTPGDRRSLATLTEGDVFDADGPELERLYDLGAVEDAGARPATRFCRTCGQRLLKGTPGGQRYCRAACKP